MARPRRSPSGESGPDLELLTTFDLDEYIFTALRNGASGCLLKDAPPAELLEAIRAVAAGDALLGPGITRRLIQEFANGPAHDSPAGSREIEERVTERELRALRLVGMGLNNEIGHRLHISPGTAKTHVAHLLTKARREGPRPARHRRPPRRTHRARLA